MYAVVTVVGRMTLRNSFFSTLCATADPPRPCDRATPAHTTAPGIAGERRGAVAKLDERGRRKYVSTVWQIITTRYNFWGSAVER